ISRYRAPPTQRGRNQRAVDPAAQQQPDGYVADEMIVDDLVPERLEPCERFLHVADLAGPSGRPVSLAANSRALRDQDRSRGDRLDAVEKAVMGPRIALAEKGVKRVDVQARRLVGQGRERLDLAGEPDRPPDMAVIKRLDADRISRQDE